MIKYLPILEKWACPTCGQSLAGRSDHCGESESHLLRRTEASAAKRLRELYRVSDDADLDDALRLAGEIPRAAHRPPKGTHGPRQLLMARVDPEAIRRIEIARKNKGQSLGDYLSEHGFTLPEMPQVGDIVIMNDKNYRCVRHGSSTKKRGQSPGDYLSEHGMGLPAQ